MKSAIDFYMLKEEVLDKGIGAALPSALSDTLLDAVFKDFLGVMKDCRDDKKHTNPSGIMSIMLKMVCDIRGEKFVYDNISELSFSETWRKFNLTIVKLNII